MKKALLTFAIVLFAVAAQAQFKIHSDSHISIGSLTRNFGVQVQPTGTTYFRTQVNNQYSLATRSKANADHQKHWTVYDCYGNTNSDLFFVYGNGNVWSTDSYTIQQNQNDSKAEAEPINSEDALATILRMNGYYYDDNTMLTEEEILGSESIKEEAKAEIVNDLEKRRLHCQSKTSPKYSPTQFAPTLTTGSASTITPSSPCSRKP